MKLSITCLSIVLSVTALAWSPFKQPTASGTGTVQRGDDPGRPTAIESRFNPKELLETRKSEFYTEALVRLERLEDQPLCHRVAAQLLMENCRGLDGIDKQTYQLNSDHTQKHHIEAFTASLTVCEMEEVSFPVPDACLPFSSASIIHHANEVGHLEVSREQTVDCKIAIHQNPSNQHIWSNFITSATVFCRAARSELENDQHILLHKKLLQNLVKFSEAVHEDLEMTRKKMADNAKVADSHLEAMVNKFNDWTIKLKQSFQSASQDVEDVESAMSSIAKNSKTAARMTDQLVKHIYQSTAEISSEQEKALTVGTTQVQHEMEIINIKLRATEDGLATLAAAVNSLLPMVKSLSEQVEASLVQSKAAEMLVANTSEAIQFNTVKLQQLSGQASNLNVQLAQASEKAQLWVDTLSLSSSVPNWMIIIGAPVVFVAFGNFGNAASLASNIKLGLAGSISGQAIILTRHPIIWATCQRGMEFIKLLSSFQAPSAVTHKARMGKESLVTTPTGLDLPSTTDITRSEMI